jgi:formylglycine-generating enzyme required for sulfatase activity
MREWQAAEHLRQIFLCATLGWAAGARTILKAVRPRRQLRQNALLQGEVELLVLAADILWQLDVGCRRVALRSVRLVMHMPGKIFISYSKQQPEPTRDVAALLTSAGYAVWWDTNLTSGEIFREIIDRELNAADAVIVIWTHQSVSSKWVLAEADHADRTGKLITLRTKDVEPWRIAKPYNTYHTDVVDNYTAILAAVRRVAGPAPTGSNRQETGAVRLARDAPPSQDHRMRVEGRVLVDAAIAQSANGKWFLPGAGQAEWFKDHEWSPEMVVVPAGSFMMGSPDMPAQPFLRADGTEPERESWPSPRHEVAIAQPFAVARHAISRGQFAAFVSATGHKMEGGAIILKGYKWERDPKGSWRAPGFIQDDSHPVVCVNWDDAKVYAKWLARITGKPYRLLSEAEREYVTLAGRETPFWWGSWITADRANYNGRVDYEVGGSEGEWRKSTVPVDSFGANPWGIYNVHGNVWEWCEDVWHENYISAPVDGSAWLQGGEARLRVVRGGSWESDPRDLRAADRRGISGLDWANIIGFRLARTLDL